MTASSPRETRIDIRIHSSRQILDEDRQVLEGVPVTAVPRTLLDLAAIDPFRLERALDSARRLGLLDPIEIDSLIRRSRGLRGVARLRDAMELHRDPSMTRSALERRFVRLVRESGLPRPSVNYFVAGHELDMYWPEHRFAVELDTYAYHGDPMHFESDRLRDEDLRLAGIEVTRVTGQRVDTEPREVMRRLAKLLSRRRVPGL